METVVMVLASSVRANVTITSPSAWTTLQGNFDIKDTA